MGYKLAAGSGSVIKKLFYILIGLGVLFAIQAIYPHFIEYIIIVMFAFGAFVFLFSFWFFRDPDRFIDMETQNDKAIIAPADGKVIKVENFLDEEYRMEESQIVSIFMSVFDVHVNRYPVKGKVEYVNYKKGKFMAAWNDKASEYNEQTVIGIRSGNNLVTVKQIAGLIAKRIVCYADVGDDVQQGQKLGLIKFGSRVDVILPINCDLKVKIGDRVKAGETVLGEFFQ
ncbi:MAG TPA: phosphatidylserine decarboxylase family protein [Clostridiales bacterium]|jgi:phosphatidylserine decarboxylase|nr:phosphatidylserine decarboxylase family protein [Clostridiales bacterium]HQP69744.1 phosphatidylserine decarboxylase family protein [Clostridiales bacterium]